MNALVGPRPGLRFSPLISTVRLDRLLFGLGCLGLRAPLAAHFDLAGRRSVGPLASHLGLIGRRSEGPLAIRHGLN